MIVVSLSRVETLLSVLVLVMLILGLKIATFYSFLKGEERMTTKEESLSADDKLPISCSNFSIFYSLYSNNISSLDVLHNVTLSV